MKRFNVAMLQNIPWSISFWSARQRFAGEPALFCADGTITHLDLARRTAAIAESLLEAGATQGETVVWCLPNGTDAVAATYAILVGGWCEVPINTQSTPSERERFVRLAGARFAICEDADAGAFAALGCRIVCPARLASRDFLADRFEAVDPAKWARFVFTSGSTGDPKAVVHSQAGRWSGTLLQRAALPVTPRPGMRLLAMTPFSHGASLLTHAFLDGGAAVELLRGVDLERVLPALRSGEVDVMFAPPTVLAKICAALAGERIRSLRAILTGTAPLPPNVYRAARDIFGPIVRMTYGKSEAFNPIAVLDSDATDAFLSSDEAKHSTCVGWLEAGVEVRIRDEQGYVAPTGQSGEIDVRTQHMSIGTFDGALHLWPDGWHATGDVGKFDERGRLHLVGRVADAIKSGGYKVYPAEVEQALASAPDLPSLAIVALPSEYWGDIIAAVAETADDSWRARAEEACESLARYKRPRFFVEMSELPRNAQHKVVRRAVVERLLRAWRLEDGPRPKLVPVDGA